MKIRLLFPPDTPADLIARLLGTETDEHNARGAWLEITDDEGRRLQLQPAGQVIELGTVAAPQPARDLNQEAAVMLERWMQYDAIRDELYQPTEQLIEELRNARTGIHLHIAESIADLRGQDATALYGRLQEAATVLEEWLSIWIAAPEDLRVKSEALIHTARHWQDGNI